MLLYTFYPTIEKCYENVMCLLGRDCFNHKGSCTLFRSYSTIAAGISSSIFVRFSTRQSAVSSLSKGISSILNFHKGKFLGTILKYGCTLRPYPVNLKTNCAFYISFSLSFLTPPPFYYGKPFSSPLWATQNGFGPLYFAQPPQTNVFLNTP